ncbi:MAG: DMT family transporter [Succiniclasticum sp.]|uniref:DMT family transporter n=1 Tax=Succiniclasticum sp. TaxID=2775030 RepID=UPI002A914D7B|nr:DMT family transporter [Succiniclasticum sp.]MDY6290950.1 DMT family transporter [Succiniclasticum sp.]
MKNRLILLLVALVWGTTFIFQRISTGTMGTFSFIGLRFILGAAAILPLVFLQKKRNNTAAQQPADAKKTHAVAEIPDAPETKETPWPLWLCGCIIGCMLFGGSAFQQQALIYTTAGKAAFITSLYIIAVPLVGLLIGQPLRITHIVGCLLSVCGLYFLAFQNDGQPLNFGDFLTLIGVLFWTLQILFIDRFVRWYPSIYLAEGQFITASVLGFIGVFLTGEPLSAEAIRQTAVPILYAGIMSSGVGYTLQIIGQAKVPPTEATMLMSCEMIFGALSGFLFLNETMTLREFSGCLLMTGGIFLAQLPGRIIWYGRRS